MDDRTPLTPASAFRAFAARSTVPLTAPEPVLDVAIEEEDFCPECGPGRPGRVLETDQRYAYDLTPPAWEPCETCAQRVHDEAAERYAERFEGDRGPDR